MPKALCILAMTVAVLLLLIFGLDMAIGFPFSGQSKSMDIGFMISAVVVGYLGWSALREQV
jgi:hypothetical protein